MTFSTKPSLKKMWKLSWIKSGTPEPGSDDDGSETSSSAPMEYTGLTRTPPAVTIEKAPTIDTLQYQRGAHAYTPTSPLSLSQASSMRSFMKHGPNQPHSCPSSHSTPGSIAAPAPPMRMKRKDSIVGSSGRLLDVRNGCNDGRLDFLTYLPYEIAMVVVIYADYPAIATISQVSRSWSRFSRDNAVWRRLFLQQREWRTPRALATACGSRRLRHKHGDSGNSSHVNFGNVNHVNFGNSPALSFSSSGMDTPNASGMNTPRVGDDTFLASDGSTPLTSRILSAYSGSSLRPAINLQHMVAPSPTMSIVGTPHIRSHADWRYLFQQRLELDRHWRMGIADVHILSGHGDSVYCVQYDYDRIVTGSRDRTVKVWDTNTLQCLRTLSGHDASVLCLKYDSTALVTGSSDSTVIVWDWATGTPRLRLASHAAGVLDVAFNAEFIVSCSKDCTIKVWRRSDGKLLRTMAGHRGPVNAVQLHGNRIVSASGDSLIKMWDIKTGDLIRTFAGHTRGLACVQFDGTTIVSGSSDQLIKVWDAETGQCTQTMRGHKDLVRTLHFAGGKRAVSGSYDQTIKVWDIQTGECTLDLKDVHTSWVFDVQFSASKIVSTSQDQKIVIWDFAKGLDISSIN